MKNTGWLRLLIISCLMAGCAPATEPNGEPETGAAEVVEKADQESASREPEAMTDEGAADESVADEGPDPILFAGLLEPRGLRLHDAEQTSDGYVLFSPLISDTTYLIDRDGQVVHLWEGDYAAGSEYLLDDGHLLRGARVPDAPRFNGGGQNGRIEKLNWEGEVVWSFQMADEEYLLHHDFERMPNGNVLAIAWEAITPEEALAAGRVPDKLPKAGLWPDLIVEIEPSAEGGRVVWRWRAWDHLVQNTDPDLPNYGEPADHPGRVDVNTGNEPQEITAEDLAEAKATNQAPGTATVNDRGSDFQHSNAVDYNAELDQIALSVRALSEIWIIDHDLTEEEAAGPAGDILYRWGNPQAYGHEAVADGLGHQHDIRWIEPGYPGAGNVMAFSNDAHGAERPHSEVVEFTPPMDAEGNYLLEEGKPFGPNEVTWSYKEEDFYSPFISGAHRLPDGNTLITFGPQGRFVEVTRDGEVAWEYWTPYTGDVRMPDGTWPQPGAPFFYGVFRATFIPADHPGLAGRTLTPLDPQPQPSVIPEDELAPFRRESAD
jgi:hypothetical protein